MPTEPEDEFKIVIVSPDKVVLEATVVKALVPGVIQELAILPNHTPLYSELGQGTVTAFYKTGRTKQVDIDGGILRVRHNKVSIILGFVDDNAKKKKK